MFAKEILYGALYPAFKNSIGHGIYAYTAIRESSLFAGFPRLSGAACGYAKFRFSSVIVRFAFKRDAKILSRRESRIDLKENSTKALEAFGSEDLGVLAAALGFHAVHNGSSGSRSESEFAILNRAAIVAQESAIHYCPSPDWEKALMVPINLRDAAEMTIPPSRALF
jgi:hypothetical protein